MGFDTIHDLGIEWPIVARKIDLPFHRAGPREQWQGDKQNNNPAQHGEELPRNEANGKVFRAALHEGPGAVL